MRKQTVFALAAIAAILLIFIVVYEQHTLSSGELESRRGQVLERFVRARAHGIKIQRGDDVVVDLVRDAEAVETLDTFDVGSWRVVAPVEGPADTDAIDGLLLSLDSLSARRSIQSPSSADRAQFGLDAPRLILTLRVADETQILRVGADDERVGGTYVEVEGRDRVDIVGRDFFEALDRPTEHYRSRALFQDLLTRDVTALSASLARDGGERVEARLSRRDGRWYASEPFEGWAHASSVKSLLDALVEARAVRFASSSDEGLLADPSVRLVLTTRVRDADGRDTGRTSEQTVLVGAACPAPAPAAGPLEEDEPSRTARAVRVDAGPILCVPEAALSPLFGFDARLRETRMLSADADRVERFLFATGEGRSEEIQLEVRREDDGWRFRERGADLQAADADAVAAYLGALHDAEAESFAPADAAALSARGLDRPRLRVRFHHTDGETIEYVDVGSVDTVGVWVRRGEEPSIARYPLTVDEALTASALRFRSRDVLSREADDVVGLRITRAGVEERLGTDDGAWRIEAPIAAPADRVAVRELIGSLSRLRAARWVSEGDRAGAGLDRPRLRVHLEFREPHAAHGDGEEGEQADHAEPADAPREVDVVIGAETEGGAYARVEGSSDVFVLPTALLEALGHPLVDRELVALDVADATRLRLTANGTTYELSLREGTWWHGDAQAAPDATAAFLDRLRTLRARGVVAYGEGALSGTPSAVVEVSNDEATRTLTIGAVSGEGDDASASARTSEIAAEFRVSGDVARAIASYRP